MFAARRHVVGFHHLVALHGFEVDVEAPQAMQVLEHFVGGVAQRFAVVLLVAQGQRAVAAAVDAPDLDVGLAVAQVVLGGQLLTDVR
jgi:hypothetical protein